MGGEGEGKGGVRRQDRYERAGGRGGGREVRIAGGRVPTSHGP